jgi:hypothetical protein
MSVTAELYPPRPSGNLSGSQAVGRVWMPAVVTGTSGAIGTNEAQAKSTSWSSRPSA